MLNKYIFNKQFFIFILFILVATFVVKFHPLGDISEAWIDQNIINRGYLGVLYFIGAFSLFTAVGFPRQLTAFLGGYAFGFSEGTIYATVSATLGCLSCFVVARFIARPSIMSRFEKKLKSLRAFLNQDTFTKTVIIRLLPIGSNLLTNLIAGATKIKMIPFVSGSFLGYIPQMVIFALAGSGVEVMSYWKIAISVLLFIISAFLTAKLYRNYKNNFVHEETAMQSS